MTRPISLQVYVSEELAARVRTTAAANGMAVSEWLRGTVFRACESDIAAPGNAADLARLNRQSLFAMVGVDALLAGHPDEGLRARTHKAFARQCKDAGLVSGAIEGGSHEA
jgi:hypothetical protein